MTAKRFTNPSNSKDQAPQPMDPDPVLPEEDQHYTAGYLRGLRPSEVTYEMIMKRLHDPNYNPLAGVEPTNRARGGE